jgi:hypothetical protein
MSEIKVNLSLVQMQEAAKSNKLWHFKPGQKVIICRHHWDRTTPSGNSAKRSNAPSTILTVDRTDGLYVYVNRPGAFASDGWYPHNVYIVEDRVKIKPLEKTLGELTTEAIKSNLGVIPMDEPEKTDVKENVIKNLGVPRTSFYTTLLEKNKEVDKKVMGELRAVASSYVGSENIKRIEAVKVELLGRTMENIAEIEAIKAGIKQPRAVNWPAVIVGAIGFATTIAALCW